MPVLGPKSSQEEIDAFNEYFRRDRERRYTPEQLAEMQALVDAAEAKRRTEEEKHA